MIKAARKGTGHPISYANGPGYVFFSNRHSPAYESTLSSKNFGQLNCLILNCRTLTFEPFYLISDKFGQKFQTEFQMRDR